MKSLGLAVSRGLNEQDKARISKFFSKIYEYRVRLVHHMSLRIRSYGIALNLGWYSRDIER
jgi:hypothetical protein